LAKKQRRRKVASGPAESRVAEVATVAWMLSAMTTLLCASTAAIVWLAVHDREGHPTAVLFGRMLHFSAIVTAVVSLALVGVVIKIRRVPPPASITIFAVIVAVLPILAAFL
jgi:hypothetical protein